MYRRFFGEKKVAKVLNTDTGMYKNKTTRTFECTHIDTDSHFQLCSVNLIFYCSILPPNLASHSSIVGIVPSNFSG